MNTYFSESEQKEVTASEVLATDTTGWRLMNTVWKVVVKGRMTNQQILTSEFLADAFALLADTIYSNIAKNKTEWQVINAKKETG